MRKIIGFILLITITIIVKAQVNNNTIRSIDGSGNNLQNPSWGQSGAQLLRKLPIAFDDKISIPTGGYPTSRLLSTRLISNAVAGRKAEYDIPDDLSTTNLLTFWGQFIDHDITFSLDTSNAVPNACYGTNYFPIPIPKGDPFYDSAGTGTQLMNFCRLINITGTGTSTSNPLQFSNIITAWVDGSQVYGYTNDRATALRTLQGGLLKTSPGLDGDYLPINNDGNGNTIIDMANPANKFPNNQLYYAGDLRANENPVLLSLHTLFVREHNRRAKLMPNTMTDEQIYQAARLMVIAHIQAITYNEFLPTILGQPFPAYNAYDPTVNPNIDSFFSTVAYRFGHDMLSDIISRLDPYGKSIPQGNVLLRDGLFDVLAFSSVGASCILRGAAVHPQRLIDSVVEDDVRLFLYGRGPATATDLVARNMQRARDVGLGFYNDARNAYGLSTCSTFDCVSSDPSVVAILNNLYGQNNVSFLDCFVGGLLETKANPNSKLGPLFSAAVIDQFSRIRNGDRFWYQNPGVLTSAQLNEIQNTKLTDIIKRNTDSIIVPSSGFLRANVAPEQVYNPVNNTGWIAAIIVLTIIAAVLIIVIIGLCFSRASGSKRVNDNELYTNLNEK